MQERRKCSRMRALKGAKLIVGKTQVFDCVVHNLTAQGARIEIPNTVPLPARLQITFNDGRLSRACRIVWREFSEAGLEYAETGRLLA
jgi:hypothetical protein